MLAKVYTCAVIGLDTQIVEVEVDTGRGLPAFFIVGLPDAAVKESSERGRSAIKNSGLHMHGGRVTVNLAPADLRKAGPAYDLPMAIGVLAATDQIPCDDLDTALFVGELGLDGQVRHVRGVLPVAAFAAANGYRRIFAPKEDACEAALIDGVEVIPVESLTEVVNHLHGIDVPFFSFFKKLLYCFVHFILLTAQCPFRELLLADKKIIMPLWEWDRRDFVRSRRYYITEVIRTVEINPLH